MFYSIFRFYNFINRLFSGLSAAISSFLNYLLRAPASIPISTFLAFTIIWATNPSLFFYKLLAKHCYFLTIMVLFFMTMNFLNFLQYSSKNNSFLQRFWKRALVLFWSIEMFTFGIFVYLALFSSELSRFFISQNQHSQIQVQASWYWPMASFILIAVLSTATFLLTFKRMAFAALIMGIIILAFSGILWLFYILEFAKFFLTLSFFSKKDWVVLSTTAAVNNPTFKIQDLLTPLQKFLVGGDLMDLQDSIFSQNTTYKIKSKLPSAKFETKTFFSMLIVILKFWHVFFVVFFISSFFKNNIGLFDLSSNANLAASIVNLNFLSMFNFIGYIFLVKRLLKPIIIPSYSLWSETTSFGFMSINNELALFFFCLKS